MGAWFFGRAEALPFRFWAIAIVMAVRTKTTATATARGNGNGDSNGKSWWVECAFPP